MAVPVKYGTEASNCPDLVRPTPPHRTKILGGWAGMPRPRRPIPPNDRSAITDRPGVARARTPDVAQPAWRRPAPGRSPTGAVEVDNCAPHAHRPNVTRPAPPHC